MVKLHRHILQVFICTVQEVNNEGFSAEMTDITNPNNPKEYITTSLDRLLCEVDRKTECKIHNWGVGVSFFWTIGKCTSNDITEDYIKVQTIDYGKWKQSDIEKAKCEGKKLAKFFNP